MKKDIKFEDAMLALEDAVKRLESGSISLDEAIATYEEAIKLVRVCNDKLDGAEQKVRILTEGADGAVTDLPFIGEENEN
ncbi:MAG: exodeoxyribonuclease VII small subunit [Clostridia bacterium]|nr:exodeoxyribonuclease VII small subunit [Clostridia bacterium]